MGELAKPESIEDVIRDKVRRVIVEAIPDEQVDDLIKKEYDKFFEDVGGYHTKPSPFKMMVQAEIESIMSKKI